ncbi:MAG: eCIS core domain-containing protein [Pyrinomonadaceae bacterium]
MARHELRHLCFHCLLQQLPRPAAQHFGQRLRHRQRHSWIPILNDCWIPFVTCVIFLHGVFLLSNKVDGSPKLIKNTPPFSFAHTQLSSLTPLLEAITWGHGIPLYVPGGNDNDAFTLDDHIYFATGKYTPLNGISNYEIELIGHEVTHSRQYRQSKFRVWSVREVTNLEPSLTELVDLPPGTSLSRLSAGAPWKIREIEEGRPEALKEPMKPIEPSEPR